MQQRKSPLTIILMAAAFISSPALAQAGGHRLAACKDDIGKYCASDPRGHGKIRACLEANKEKLAPDCRTALEGASQ